MTVKKTVWYNISMAREDLVATQAETEIIPMATIEGICNFSNVTEHDVFNGQDTGQFSMTITMNEADASELAALGVKIKDYQGAKQRKFKSIYDVKTFDAEGNPYEGEVPYNSKVRLKYKLGNAHPVHGVSTYLEAVKVLEEAELELGEVADF